mgnify:CR=1 FL=1
MPAAMGMLMLPMHEELRVRHWATGTLEGLRAEEQTPRALRAAPWVVDALKNLRWAAQARNAGDLASELKASLLADALDRQLFNGASLADAPPWLLVNATNLMTGKSWKFFHDRAGDYLIGATDRTEGIRLADAVLASAAYPGLTDPFPFQTQWEDLRADLLDDRWQRPQTASRWRRVHGRARGRHGRARSVADPRPVPRSRARRRRCGAPDRPLPSSRPQQIEETETRTRRGRRTQAHTQWRRRRPGASAGVSGGGWGVGTGARRRTTALSMFLQIPFCASHDGATDAPPEASLSGTQ